MTHNAVRQAGYWIINGRSSVSQQLRKCTICQKLSGPVQVQKMANLQEERITPAAPFTYSGMDAFGPLLGNGLCDCHAVKLNFVPFVLVT